MIIFLIKCKNFIFDILFPPICLHCRKVLIYIDFTQIKTKNNSQKSVFSSYQPVLCENCYNSIQLNTSLFCPVCRSRLAENKKICNHLDYLLGAAGNYDDAVLRDLIHYFKYESFENLSLILGEMIINYIRNLKLEIRNFVIIPVPLHRAKEKQRGFNQSKLLAEIIAGHFNLKIIDALKRVKKTRQQAQCKNSEERTENVKNCFTIKNSAIESVKNQNILLIDDVFTTGATMNEAVKILKQNNARKIITLVVAKT